MLLAMSDIATKGSAMSLIRFDLCDTLGQPFFFTMLIAREDKSNP